MENVPNQMFLLGLLCPCSCVIVQQGSMDLGLLLCISSHLRLRPSISQQGQYRILICAWVDHCLAAAKLSGQSFRIVLQGARRTCNTAL